MSKTVTLRLSENKKDFSISGDSFPFLHVEYYNKWKFSTYCTVMARRDK